MNVNFWGVVHGVEAFVPLLIEQGQGGHIVNTASMAGLVGMRWLGIYSASKFAVVGLTEALHRELKPHGIGVSVLCPMIVDTEINENSVRMRPRELRNAGEDPLVPPPAADGRRRDPERKRWRAAWCAASSAATSTSSPIRSSASSCAAAPRKLDAMFEEENW